MTESNISLEHMAQQFTHRSARAAVGLLRPADASLRLHLARWFDQPPGVAGSFLAEPVIENMFPWLSAKETLSQFTGSLLHPKTVAALTKASFDANTRPYVHQVESWKALKNGKSVVVTTGTGSGKTECFLVPILDDLIREAESSGPLTGLRALFLYPLNALIASQRDRLTAWTKPLGGSVRFALYNGNTPEEVKKARQAEAPEEALDRKALRANPPPLLVTNPTMLEYILLRKQDEPILTSSRGKLRWIVLDEAHTYDGSNAAEIALLLRRTMSAFDVDAKTVRFIATSATIAQHKDEKERAENGKRLKRYLADLSGLDESQVEVIGGSRDIPTLPGVKTEATLADVLSSSDSDRFATLSRYPPARALRQALAKSEGLTVSELRTRCKIEKADDVLHLLDVAHTARSNGTSFLPIRAHFFHRTLQGLWTCINPNCEGKKPHPELEQWPYGRVFDGRLEKCPDCASLVFELLLCARCGEPHLLGNEEDTGKGPSVLPVGGESLLEDEQIASDPEDSEDDEETFLDGTDNGRVLHAPFPGCRDLQPFETARKIGIQTGILDVDDITARLIHVLRKAEARCLRCNHAGSGDFDTFRAARAGGPFFLQSAIPVLLEASAPADNPQGLPMGGRRTLTFSDSRQGSASFALKAQIEAERNFIRGWLWHTLAERGAGPSPEMRAILEEKITAMRTINAEMFKSDIRQKESELRGAGPLTWREAADELSQHSQIKDILQKDWAARYGAYTFRQVADTLLMRELMRRPNRANSAETMGLAAMEWPNLGQNYPREATALGLSHAEWRNFLCLVIDHIVRARWAVRVPDELKRWLGIRVRQFFLVPPGGKRSTVDKNVPWLTTKTKRPHRLTALLANACGREVRAPEIEEALLAAWHCLVDNKFLHQEQDGFRLDVMDQAALARIIHAAA